MRTLDTPADFVDLVGETLGESDWVEIGQDQITDFARVTGDDFWIHVDTDRAARELPGGRTIAHGLMLLAMVPALQRQIFHVRRRGIGLNYGSDRVRYTSSVPEGSRVRLRQSVKAAERHGAATRLVTTCVLDVEGAEKPGFVADFILLLHDA